MVRRCCPPPYWFSDCWLLPLRWWRFGVLVAPLAFRFAVALVALWVLVAPLERVALVCWHVCCLALVALLGAGGTVAFELPLRW